MNMHLKALFQFVLPYVRIGNTTKHSNSVIGRRMYTPTSFVFMFKAVDGRVFIKKQVVVTTSTQKIFGTYALESRHLTLSSMVMFNLYVRPFYQGVLTIDLCLVIPTFCNNHGKIKIGFKTII